MNERETAQDAAAEDCFHCGLEIRGGSHGPSLTVLNRSRWFCCPGCFAVCEAIAKAGLEDYYRLRETPPAGGEKVPEALENVTLYDRPEVQRQFVSRDDRGCEAALLLEDIRCPACLWLNERQLRAHPGVLAVDLDYTRHRARVRWDPDRTRLSDILKAIAAIGYVAHPYDPSHSRRLNDDRKRRSTERLLFAGFAAMLVMQFAVGGYLMGGPGTGGSYEWWEQYGRWIGGLITLLVVAYPGQEFLAGAAQAVRNRRLNMDVPIVVGILTALVASAVSTISGQGDVYYDSIVMLIFFVLLARRYEMRGRVQAAHCLDRLNTLTPRTVLRLGEDGAREIPLLDVVAGDRLRILPGESLPVDGTITSGTSTIDESLISGESIPVARGPGDSVLGGSVNGDQPLEVQATRTAGNGVVAEIRALADRALYDKPGRYQIVDRVAARFVAVVLALAACSGFIWWAAGDPNWLVYLVSVLIVSCPCALALATPVALAVSTGQSVAEGVLPLRLSAMDGLARADTVVFDKTGTLTEGRLVLSRVVVLGGLPQSDLRRIAGAMSRFSEHPVARALRTGTPDDPAAAVDRVEVVPGAGIHAAVDGASWHLGNARFVAEHGAPPERDQAAVLAQAGDIVTYLADRSGIQAAFVLSDRMRRDAVRVVRELRELGVTTITLLSGDGEANTRSIAEAAGITEFHAALSPGEKVDYLQRLRAGGRRVVAVGDGINDAPLLAAADASIAVAGATDLAKLSSDFVVLGDKLSAIGGVWHRARRTRRIVRQNLAWAFGYNVTAIPLAALGLVPPWLAAIGMSLSSLLVVSNALRLRANQRKAHPRTRLCRA